MHPEISLTGRLQGSSSVSDLVDRSLESMFSFSQPGQRPSAFQLSLCDCLIVIID
jgi:hypothetical protein